MKLFLPSARATNCLLIVGFCSLGYALYIRYLAIEQSARRACLRRRARHLAVLVARIVIALFKYSVFGWAALAVARVNLLRPSLVVFAVALALSCLGIVLYNIQPGFAGRWSF